MSNYSKIQKIDIVEAYIESGRQPKEAQTLLRRLWGNWRAVVARSTFLNLYKTWREVGGVEKPKNRLKTARSVENIEHALELVEEASRNDQPLSVRRLASEIGVCNTTAWKILRKDLKVKPYRLQLVHELNEDDFDRRVQFSEEFLERLRNEDQNLAQKILWTDEAIFSLAGHVNRHNCCYWDSQNPNKVQSVNALSAPRVMVWAGIHYEGVIGPFFFEGSVTGARYKAMLEEKVFPALEEVFGQNFGEQVIFMQDGAPAHYARDVRSLLDEKFTEWIGRRGKWEWPARSPDMTVCDFFLWGHLKHKVYGRGPKSLTDLKRFIEEELDSIPSEMIESACESVENRFQCCIDLNGKQLALDEEYR